MMLGGRREPMTGRSWKDYALLEARRNRLLYRAWPLIILGTLPLAALLASTAGVSPRAAISAAVAAWLAGGLPLTAVLFGAVAGSGLRGRAEEDDAALPLAPRQRALSALAIAAAAVVANAGLLAALWAGLFPNWLHLIGGSGQEPFVVAAVVAASAASGLLWLTAVSFLGAFICAHAVLGGIVALASGALAGIPIAGGLLLKLHYSWQGARFLLPAATCSALMVAGAVGAAALAAPAVARSRRLGWRKAALLLLLPVAASFGSLPALYGTRRLVLGFEEHIATDPRPLGKDDLRSSMGGRLVRVEGSGGRTVLLPGEQPTLGELISGRPLSFIRGAHRDPQGWVWAEVLHPLPGKLLGELWVGRGEGPLKRYMVLPEDKHLSVYKHAAVLYMYGYIDEHAPPPEGLIFLDATGRPPLLK
jgi:hypothetical protein